MDRDLRASQRPLLQGNDVRRKLEALSKAKTHEINAQSPSRKIGEK